jgi:hypothetical protein
LKDRANTHSGHHLRPGNRPLARLAPAGESAEARHPLHKGEGSPTAEDQSTRTTGLKEV